MRALRSRQLVTRSLPALALLGCVLASACASAPPSAPSEGERKVGTLADLEAILARQSAKPVEGTLFAQGLPKQGGPQEPAVQDPAPPAATDAPQDPAASQPAAPPDATAAPAADAAGQPAAQPEAQGELQAFEELLKRAESQPALTPTQPAAPQATPSENPYLAFGSRIVVHTDGRVTKPYPMPPKKGRRLLDLLQLYGDFPVRFTIRGPSDAPASMPARPEGVIDDVECMLLEEWDIELYQDMRSWPPTAPNPVALADWLVVTARPERLHEVEDFLNLFAAAVPQIEIEAKIVEITESDVLDLGVKPVATGTPIFDAPGNGTFIKGLDYSFPTQDLSSALLTLGAVQDGLAFNAVLQALATWENVQIDSQPRIAVREGSKAEIVNITKIPFYNLNNINAANQYTAQLSFEEVGVKLYIVPRVVGTDTVALNIDIEASQQAGNVASLITSAGGVGALANPIIAKRGARTVVYLQPGQAVILGGLTTTRDSDTIRKVPLLGDIPFLGALFRSKLKRKEKTHVLFFIRPRILQGIDVQRDF
ncbi:MAG: type II secretion system protein GspD [Planctomycetota bacterium]|nr:MAG: type II secretion system protein GspD [Planctomycetota bacterium]